MNRENLTDIPLTKYEGTELERYLETRYDKAPVPYTPPQSEVQPLQPAAVDLVAVARPIVGLSIVGGIVCVVASGFAAACAATFAFVSANAAWFIGGALVVGWASGLFKSAPKQDAPNQAPPNDGGKYEWYQEQRQGWRKM
jgi:hypothetical protein